MSLLDLAPGKPNTVIGPLIGHGWAYALQIGFGWTDGVQAALMTAYAETKGATAP